MTGQSVRLMEGSVPARESKGSGDERQRGSYPSEMQRRDLWRSTVGQGLTHTWRRVVSSSGASTQRSRPAADQASSLGWRCAKACDRRSGSYSRARAPGSPLPAGPPRPLQGGAYPADGFPGQPRYSRSRNSSSPSGSTHISPRAGGGGRPAVDEVRMR
jgi:hypothetical protein